jgi:hypothetical protein
LVNPGLKPEAFLIGRSVPEQAEEDILGEIFRHVPVEGHARQVIEQPLVVPVKQQGGLLKITVLYGFHDLFIRHPVRFFLAEAF